MAHSNKSLNDILLRAELQKYADENADRFKLCHVLSTAPDDQDFPVKSLTLLTVANTR